MRYRYFLYHPDLKQPVRLKYEPVGWDSLQKERHRDRKTHGIVFSYTPKIKFIKDGKGIIHNLYETYGPEAEIEIYIDKQNSVTRRWGRDFTGRLNLMTLSISTLYVECNIENTGFLQRFKNYQNAKINLQSLRTLDENKLDVFGQEFIDLTLHSKVIELVNEARRSTDPLTDTISQENYPGYTDNDHHTVDPWFVQTDFVEISGEFGERVYFPDGYTQTPLETDRKYVLKVPEGLSGPATCNLKFRVKFIADSAGDGSIINGDHMHVKLFLKHRRYLDTVITTYQVNVHDAVFDTPDLHDTGFLDVALDQVINLEPNDEIYYYWEFSHECHFFDNEQHMVFDLTSDNYFKVTMNSTFTETETKAVLVHEAFARVCQAITGRADAFRSNYYGRVDSDPVVYAADGEGSLRAILNGFMVRGFPLANPSFVSVQNPDGVRSAKRILECSLKDLLDTFGALDGVSVGIEVIDGKEYIIVEDLGHFYQAQEIMKLDFVTGWDAHEGIKKEVAEDYYYNELEAGAKKWRVTGGAINHLDEFNTYRNYILPITQVQRKLTLVSPYILAGYAIEATRRENINVSDTKDHENDNENFIIQVKRNGGGFETAKDEAFDSIEGVLSPETIYNADLSIGRSIRRNGRLIRSFLEKQKDRKLRISGVQGSRDLVSKRADEATEIVDGDDILISTLDKPLWLPEIYKIKSPLTDEQHAALDATPYGYVSFSNTNKDHKKMFVLDTWPDPKTRAVRFLGLKANL